LPGAVQFKGDKGEVGEIYESEAGLADGMGWCKAAFPYTVPSTDTSLLSTVPTVPSTDASPRMVLSTDGSEHRLIPAKNR
jgi:hypothetical protein